MSKMLTVGKIFTEVSPWTGEVKRVVRFICPTCGQISMTLSEAEVFGECAECAYYFTTSTVIAEQ